MEINVISVFVFMGIPSAFTGFCFWLLQRHMNRDSSKREAREIAREKNEFLLIKSVGASIALGEACAIAMRNGKCNGETEAALEYARTVKHEQKDFLAEQGLKNLY